MDPVESIRNRASASLLGRGLSSCAPRSSVGDSVMGTSPTRADSDRRNSKLECGWFARDGGVATAVSAGETALFCE
ncbi:hypothetical protein SERLADRAFT_397907 [Serpula lacrymans var. lacrymans S7.9]|uniref:Uncharacterized protein n=1 Tax=Serpula lacrymans var. lacrymans (strain S7.9) TaxID=578457 RepID=F8P667_SERL9|nr:uncharacterized protein SERLADRAFT_397907 [Serpula lacrymans var. lacrymans S7.9]EGO20934.1 hypothetical protein SERLADRAFT_397907 [Serpula lacrymans var. lacrymans S7.9]